MAGESDSVSSASVSACLIGGHYVISGELAFKSTVYDGYLSCLPEAEEPGLEETPPPPPIVDGGAGAGFVE